jgi:hypothetical protein
MQGPMVQDLVRPLCLFVEIARSLGSQPVVWNLLELRANFRVKESNMANKDIFMLILFQGKFITTCFYEMLEKYP